ncbi:MAG: tryptophan--tRNA ligase [Alphaproteobacteria bacterium]|nr:MAG: tryptophan--tRNA ligase [Alphaproteobacteria bacterium]
MSPSVPIPTRRVFSGAQPTGAMHLGNYLGAFRNWVRLQQSYECLYCVVDLHAITVWQDPKTLADQTRRAAAAFIAAGVDPKRSILFNQSQVAAHSELAWIFNCVARVGWLNRMTQFKDKAGKNRERASVGLYVYPTLMAADILAYKATHVPVGEDQKQHLELTRDIAARFNQDFGAEVFPLVEPVIFGPGARVMSLRDGTKKMSKSDPSDASRINLTDDADAIARKIRRAKTDPEPLPDSATGLEGRPEAANLVGIFAALADRTVDDVLGEFAGKGFAEFKNALAELAVATLGPITEEMLRLERDPAVIDRILADGAERAAAMAAPVLAEVRHVVGFLDPRHGRR